ncbi:hypothetical protein [Escherichia coli]|nr:hypothetical protein [Escherichia coli]MCW7212021.1 hypothetical protein [Escherichia coli]
MLDTERQQYIAGNVLLTGLPPGNWWSGRAAGTGMPAPLLTALTY